MRPKRGFEGIPKQDPKQDPKRVQNGAILTSISSSFWGSVREVVVFVKCARRLGGMHDFEDRVSQKLSFLAVIFSFVFEIVFGIEHD